MATDRSTRETATGKAKTIHDLLDSADEIRQAVRDDLLMLIQRVPLGALFADDDALEEYLAECVRVVVRRHVVTPQGVTDKMRQAVTGYVKGMMR